MTAGMDLPSNDIINEIEFIFKVLKQYNVSFHETNRFSQFYKSYKKLIESNNISNNFSELLEGMRDFFELKSIVSSPEILGTSVEELKLMLSGCRLPSEDSNSTARDNQYQLFLASRFSDSGMNVNCVEPDFSFEFEGVTYSVAAKRIKSRKKIYERIKEAEKQIMQFEHDGFIALSLDRLLESDNPYVLTNNPDDLVNITNELLLGLVKELFPAKYFEERSKRIKGIIVTLGIPSFTPFDSSLGYGFSLQLFPLTELGDEMEYLKIGRICEQLA
ncbi:hypothetical protein AB4114_29690 [Paenibacillus sp. 2RAB27]|uniref:hypothetical protein n=1 Tax=Paenibacillus sp. 2RAB27 TaxID=3232991 RepID=UPI003F9711F7